MKNLNQILKNLISEESGQDLIEYALVAALVGLGSVASDAEPRTFDLKYVHRNWNSPGECLNRQELT